ncbi:MAG: hypothetical protein E7605_03210 [Ruminococcaceae bacterium]|nr:hypothetical protein [Oscillospiraceae bacterium]
MKHATKRMVLALTLLLLLCACDARRPLSQEDARQIYTRVADTASEEACWQEDYILVIGNSALIRRNGQSHVAKDGDMTEERLSEAWNQNKEWLRQLLSTATADDLDCDGWRASGSGDVCSVTWGQSDVPIASTTLMLYESGTIRITVTYASGVGYESAEIYLRVAQEDEKNIFSMHGISVE